MIGKTFCSLFKARKTDGIRESYRVAIANRAFVLALVASVVFSGFAPLAAFAEDGLPVDVQPTAVDVSTLQDETGDEPIEELPPVEIPTDVPLPPTEEPVPPTEEPLPTEVEVPTVEILPTEVILPTEEPTPTPLSTEAPTATPSPTPSPTPAGTPKPSRVGPLNVTPGTSNLSRCKMNESTDVIQPGGMISGSCTFSQPSGSWYARFELDSVTPGWKARIKADSEDTGMVSGSTRIRINLDSGSTVDVEFWLQAPDTAVASTSGAMKFTARGCAFSSCFGAGAAGNSGLTASITPLGPDDMSMICTPASPISIQRASSRTFSCSIQALSGLNQTSLVVRSVTIPAAPAGWTMTTSPAGTAGAGGAITIPVNQSLAAGSAYGFSVTLSPGCSAANSANFTITSLVANTNGSSTSSNVAGPTIAYRANAPAASQTVSANVLSSNLDWSFTSEFEPQTASGQITYQVTGSGCSGWNVTTSASPFTYTGPAPGTSIPANNLTLTSTGAPTAVSGSTSNVSATSSSGGLAAPRKVLQAQPGSGNGTYQQSLGIGFTLPGSTNVGSYKSTITVTTAAAP